MRSSISNDKSIRGNWNKTISLSSNCRPFIEIAIEKIYFTFRDRYRSKHLKNHHDYFTDLQVSIFLAGLLVGPIFFIGAILWESDDLFGHIFSFKIILLFISIILSIIVLRYHNRTHHDIFHSPVLIKGYNENYELKDEYKLSKAYPYMGFNIKIWKWSITLTLTGIVGFLFILPLILGIPLAIDLMKQAISQFSNFDIKVVAVCLLLIYAYFFVLFVIYICACIGAIVIETIITLGVITSRIPLKINLLNDVGGTELFGRVIISAIALTFFVVSMIMLLMTLGTSPDINLNAPISELTKVDISNYKLVDLSPYIGYIMIFLACLIYSFIHPTLAIHQQIKNKKDEEIDRINSKIEVLHENLGGNPQNSEEIVYLIDSKKRIKSVKEWPFKIDSLIQFIGALLIPIITLIIK